MSTFESILREPLMTALGWTLLHFLWQGALIAAVLTVALRILRDRDANARYVACCAAMGLMMLAPAVTFIVIMRLPEESLAATLPAALLADVRASGLWQRISGALPQLTLFWLAGVGIFQSRLLLCWINAQRMKRRGIHPAPPAWQEAVNDLARRIGTRRAVCLLESSRAAVPMLIGWLRPVVLVPTAALVGLSPQQLRAVLAHELAHVRRHDYLINLVQAVFESVLFYHPAVWWLSDRLRVEREYCCDDIAVRIAGDAIGYAQALSCLDELRDAAYYPALASTGGILMNRIRRLVGLRAQTVTRSGGWLAPVMVSATVIAAVSAVTIARPIEHADHNDQPHFVFEHGPENIVVERIDDFDIVAFLKEINAEEAEFFSVLRDAGLDDDTLMIVLKAIGPDPRVMRSIEHAAEERDVMRKQHPHAVFIDKESQMLRRSIEEDLAAGLITRAEARDRLRELRAEQALVADHKRQLTIEFVHGELDAARARIHEQLEAGVITEDEARRQMLETKRRVHEHLMDALGGPPNSAMKEVQEKMRVLHQEIREQLDAGLITRREAEQRLADAGIALHEHMKEQMEKVRLRKLKDGQEAEDVHFGHD